MPRTRVALLASAAVLVAALAWSPTANAEIIITNPCAGTDAGQGNADAGDVQVLSFNASHEGGSFDEFPTLTAGVAGGNIRQGDEVKVTFRINETAMEDCVQVTWASYERLPGDFNWLLFDVHTESYPANGSIQMTPRVSMPDCNFLVVFALGTPIDEITPLEQYFDRTIDSRSNIGNDGCRLDEVCADVMAQALDGGDVKLTWNDVGFAQYNVYRAQGPVFAYVLRDIVDGTMFVDDTTEPGVTYRYIVEPFKHTPETTCPFVEVVAVPFFGSPIALALAGVAAAVVCVGVWRRRQA